MSQIAGNLNSKLSANGILWLQRNYDARRVLTLQQKLNIPEFLAILLDSRGITYLEGEDFLAPKLKNLLPDPFSFLDMDKAVNRIMQAFINKETVAIFGDYDVDGATSSALLKRYFDQIQLANFIYIPDRIKEGYGPNLEAFQYIKSQGASIVITVDCGTASVDVINAAKEIGLEVIVLDHHLGGETLPEAVAIVNPNRIDETSEYTYLAAVGVSFIFLVGLQSELNKANLLTCAPNLFDLLDLVALGTVCDVMLLKGVNRAFVSQGLKVINANKNAGIRALIDISQLTELPNAYHLGFLLGPRVNAGGRVGEASLGSKLLSCDNYFEAAQMAEKLNRYNAERKALEQLVLEECILQAESNNTPFLCLSGEGWHPGVIGIVASRIKEKYNKPTAIIAFDGNIGKASCRSISQVDLGRLIVNAKSQDLLIAGGGHAMAAGFTIEKSKLESFITHMNQEIGQIVDGLDNLHHRHYDAEITSAGADLSLIESLSKMEPFGTGNPKPIFKISNLYVLKAQKVGLNHISVMLVPNKNNFANNAIKGICFNSFDTEIGRLLLSPKPYNISIIAELDKNIWNGKASLQLIIRDVIID